MVIPFYNENRKIVDLLDSLFILEELPREVIFVDSGSNDGGDIRLFEAFKNYSSSEIKLRIISPGVRLFPGAARNIGILNSSMDHIVFIDVGINPNSDWLKYLFYTYQQSNIPGVFGVCKFAANSSFSSALSAICFGNESYLRVLPASIFSKSVFITEVGLFREDLRAAEDLEWGERYLKRFGKITICNEAKVTYKELPETYLEVAKKWFYSAYNTILAKQKKFITLLYFIILFGSIIFIGIESYIGLFFIICIYAYTRFINKFIRNTFTNTNINITFLIHFILISIVIDIAKVFGFSYGLAKQIMGNKNERSSRT